MKKIKITCLLLAVVTAIAAAFTGCAPQPQKEASEHMAEILEKMDLSADSSYSGQLKIWAQSKKTEQTVIETLVKSFNESYPNIRVEIETYSPDAYMTTIKNKHSAAFSNKNFSEMADVMWVTNDTIPSLNAMDMLAAINYIDDADQAFTTDNLVDAMVQDSRLGDNMYMMPRDYNQFVLLYNKWYFDSFPSAEMPDQNEPMTNQQFQELMKELHNVMKRQAKATPAGTTTMDGQVLDVNWSWGSMAYGMFKMFGGGILDSSGNVIFNSQENYNAIDWIKQAVKAGYAPLAGEDLGTQFKLFKTPFLIETRATFMDIVQNEAVGVPLNKYIGAMPLPVLDTEENYAIGAGCSGYAMYNYVNHPTEAWLFLKHVVSEKGQNAFGATGNSVPVLKSLLNDESAAWRNLPDYGIELPADFNHDAFIYKYDTNAFTMVDFKAQLPPKAVRGVVDYMINAMKSGINNTARDNYESQVKSILKKQEDYMKSEISMMQ